MNTEGLRALVETDASIIYFSSNSLNTHRFAQQLRTETARIPLRTSEPFLLASAPFVLITPTYADHYGDGAVPKQVIKFLNEAQNRTHIKGVIASGNRNFGETYGLAGSIISDKCGIPLLYKFELAGTDTDITNIESGVHRFLSRNQ